MKKLYALSLISGLILFSSFTNFAPPAGNLLVIVNKENQIGNLSAAETNIYFLRKLKSRWPGINKNIRLATRKNKCTERDAFYAYVLKMSDSEVDNYFAERQFQNAEKTPEKFNTDAEIIQFVSEEIGAISFVNAKSLTAEDRAKVKVILEL